MDDIDRCSEEKMIQIIDSMRIMLEEPSIYKRMVVIFAVDDRILSRAIMYKYRHFISNNVTDDVFLNRLTKEYLDKLFIFGIKLGSLTNEEKNEILSL